MKARALLLASLLSLGPAWAAPVSQPKLIVTILVDQLRYDYLERFHDQFAPRGLRLLTDGGAFLTFAHYDYLPTITGPGHASFLSGSTPAIHGIISNEWFDKRTLKSLNCVGDPDAAGVGADGAVGQRSPRNFIGDTFADELRLRYGSRVVGISHKDRGAILPAGKKPAGAYWFDSASGNFITSTYYMKELPAWVDAFNARKRPASFVGQTWRRLLDPKFYTWPDDAPGEGALPGEEAPVFDHTIHASPKGGFENILLTPFGNQLLAEFALAAVDGEHLGAGPQPDLLSISFSTVDAAGHRFGPYSQEVQDLMLRLDRELENLFAQLDKKIGLANVTIVLTADHGVMPTPEFASAQGLDGQRLNTNARIGGLMGDLLGKLSGRFGPGEYLLTPRIVDGNLYFNHDTLREKQLSPEDVAGFIREWALSTGKFHAVYGRGQILDGRVPGPVGQLVFHGYNAERSGDVVLLLKPFTIPGSGTSGTTHGAAWSYDTHIPVLFFGAGFKAGRYADDFSITDIVPTLCAALRMNEPAGSIGRPLVKILAEEGPGGAAPPPPSPAAQ